MFGGKRLFVLCLWICFRVDFNRLFWVGGRIGWYDCVILGEEFFRIKVSGVRRELGKSVIFIVDAGIVFGFFLLFCFTF